MDEKCDVGGVTMSEPFIIGETIKIIDGPFNDFNGVIEEVNDEKKKKKLKVQVKSSAVLRRLNSVTYR